MIRFISDHAELAKTFRRRILTMPEWMVIAVLLAMISPAASAEKNLVWSCPAATLNSSDGSCPGNGWSWQHGQRDQIVASSVVDTSYGNGTWRRWQDIPSNQYVYVCTAEMNVGAGLGCPSPGDYSDERYMLKSVVAPAPSARIGTASLIAPGSAATYFGASVTATNGLTLSRPAEIVELARALSNNPDLIYDFVRNNIEISWTYGLQKGALGALLDRHGTAFDQAHLMVELLRQAGLTANYRFGSLSLTPAQFSAWSGVTQARAACELLSSGGIPAQVNGSGNVACSTIGTGAVTGITVAHVWVSVTIGGTVYEFDPAYKAHTVHSSIDLRAATGLTANAAFDSTSSGLTSGAPTGVGFVRNLNAESLNLMLQARGADLLTYIQTNHPSDSVEKIVGASEIARETLSGVLRQTALPSASASSTWANVPDQYRTRLRVEVSKDFQDINSPSGVTRARLIDTNLFVDEIYGRKLIVEPNYPVGNQTRKASFSVQLRLTDRTNTLKTIASYTHPSLDMAPLRDGSIKLTANHPYAASSAGSGTAGDYMDVVVEKPVFMFLPLTIVHGWGHAGEGLADAWGPRNDTAAPDIPYEEFGCDACEQYYFATTGDARREQLAASWMIQSSRAADLHAAIAKSLYAHHHSLGVSTSDAWPEGIDLIPASASPTYFVVVDSFDRMDVDSAFSLTSKTSNAADRRAAVHAIAATSEALEGSVSAQVADLPDTSSTATRFEWGNRPPSAEDPSGNYGPRRFYRFDSSVWSQALALSIVEGQTSTANDGQVVAGEQMPEVGNGEMQHRRDALAGAITQYASAGFDVVVAEDAFLGPGQRGGPIQRLTSSSIYNAPSQQRGGALVATRYDANGDPVEIAHIVVGHDENSKGGGGGTQTNHQAKYDPAAAADVLKSRFVDRSRAVGVDLLKGGLTYVTPAQVSIGDGGFPYELSANLIWRGGNQASEQFGPIVHTQPQTPWTTNWHNNLTMSGSALEAMGATDARAAAGTIAAFLAQQDIYREADPTKRTQREVAAVLIGSWWMRQISGNVVTVSVGGDTRQFIRNVAGQWFSPGAAAYATLTQTGQRTPFMQLCGETWTHSRGWDYSTMSFQVTNAQGDTQSFPYWENSYYQGASAQVCGRQRGFRLAAWSFPQGVTINFVYTPQGTGQLDRFTEVNNSLGWRIRFNYDTAGRLTGFDNGLSGGDLRSVSATYSLIMAGYIDAVTDPSGAQTRFTTSVANQQHRLEEVFDADDTSIPSLRYTYDTLNRVKEARDAVALQAGPRNAYQFFIADGVRGERIDPAGGRYTVLYDTKKRPMAYLDELDRQTAVMHDGRGRVTEYIYPEEDREILKYDARNNTTELVRLPKGCAQEPCTPNAALKITAEWNTTWNKPNWILDARNNQTDFVYYPSGNGASLLNTATRPAAASGGARPVYTFTYNSRGQLLTTTDPTGVGVLNSYHSTNGNLLSSTLDPGGIDAVTGYGYDVIGNLASTTDPRLNVTEYGYDNNRRKTHTLSHNGNVAAPLIAAQKTIYDPLGRVTTEQAGTAFSGTTVTAWQTVKSMTYTETGKVKTEENGAGNRTTYTYEDMDRVFQIEDPVSRRTRFDYNVAGEVLKEIRAYGTARQQDYATYTYSLNGQRKTVKDANNNRSEYFYDGFDRLKKLCFPQSTLGQNAPNAADCEQYEFDENGNRKKLIKRDGLEILYVYDNLNREKLKDWPDGAANDVFSDYDLAGRPLWKRFGSTGGQGIDYTYGDTAKRLTAETSFGRVLAFEYDDNNNRTRVTHPDTNYISYEYDALNRMTYVRENGAMSGAGVLAHYEYDALSRRDYLTRGNGTTSDFGYDDASRLTSLSQDLGGVSFDATLGLGYTLASQLRTRSTTNTALGWWAAPQTSETYVANGLNQYASVNGVNYTHDDNGNLTGDGTRSFGYDVENRLTSVSGSASMALTYDPLGRLRQTVSGPTTTQYLYDGDRLTAEYNGSGSGTLIRRYAHGAGVDEPIVWYEGAGLTDRRWLHSDERGSVIAHTDGSGAASPYSYGPYGEQSSWSGSRFSYTGQIMLPEVRLYHYKARVYDPGIGRFLQTDPIGYDDDVNLYAYVGNDPLDRTDPTGAEWGGFSMGLTPELDPPTAREFAEGVVPGVAAYGQYESGHYVAAAGLATLDAATLGKGKLIGSLGSQLGRALASAGRPVLKGIEHAHHIVAKGAMNDFAKQARAVLEQAKIGIDDAINGVALPKAFHSGLHTLDNYRNVANRLTTAFEKGGATAARTELGKIGSELEKAAKKAACVPETGTRISKC